jgi:SAM-dependent methyltransferase
MDESYQYWGLLVSTWDLFRGDTSGWADRPFYLELIHRFGEPALDVGCGTGRLLLDYMAQGVDVDGVDDSPEMLAGCRERAAALGLEPRLYQQKMESLHLPRRYRTIIVPSSSFQLLADPAAARSAMSAFAAHLEPGGALVMPFIDRAGLASADGETAVRERTRPIDGATVRRTTTARFDEASGTESSLDVFEVIRDGNVDEREEHRNEHDVRWYSRADAMAVFLEAGLTVNEVSDGFTGTPATPDGEVFTVIATRP